MIEKWSSCERGWRHGGISFTALCTFCWFWGKYLYMLFNCLPSHSLAESTQWDGASGKIRVRAKFRDGKLLRSCLKNYQGFPARSLQIQIFKSTLIPTLVFPSVAWCWRGVSVKKRQAGGHSWRKTNKRATNHKTGRLNVNHQQRNTENWSFTFLLLSNVNFYIVKDFFQNSKF